MPRKPLANISIAAINVLIRVTLWIGFFTFVSEWIYAHRAYEWSAQSVWAWVVLFVIVDFIAYFRHLIQHKMRVL